jgi:hypothetical protein
MVEGMKWFWIIGIIIVFLIGFAIMGWAFLLVMLIGWGTEDFWNKLK